MGVTLVCLMASLLLAGSVAAKEAETAKDTFSVTHSRKSVKSFTGATVSTEALDKIVRAGMAAPTAVNKQLWSFVVVTDRKKIDALAAGLSNARGIVKSGAVIIVCAEPEKANLQSEARSSRYAAAGPRRICSVIAMAFSLSSIHRSP